MRSKKNTGEQIVEQLKKIFAPNLFLLWIILFHRAGASNGLDVSPITISSC